MNVDPFQLLGVEPGSDYSAISAAHAERCREHPELRGLYDQALIELISAAPARLTHIEMAPAPALPPAIATPTASAAGDIERGAAHLAENDLRKALAEFNRAIEIEPENVAVYRLRARAYAGLAQPALALADYDRALDLDATDAATFADRGWLHQETGENKKAMLDFNEAIRLKPDLAQAYYNRAKLFARLGQPQKARKDCDRALQIEQARLARS